MERVHVFVNRRNLASIIVGILEKDIRRRIDKLNKNMGKINANMDKVVF